MMNSTYSAFVGGRRVASGRLLEVADKAKTAWDQEEWTSVLIFDDLTSEVIDVDYSGTSREVLERLAQRFPEVPPRSASATATPTVCGEDSRKPGRPRLGVVAREVTLLPRHWEWLATQPGGASVALRKLVEHARLSSHGKDQHRRSQEATYRFISAMAGNEPGFEEATRSLFADQQKSFAEITAAWPRDVRDHARRLASQAFASAEIPPTPPCIDPKE